MSWREKRSATLIRSPNPRCNDVQRLIILTFITRRLKDFPMASAHVQRNAEKLASVRATPPPPRLVNILHAVGAELALRRALWPRSPHVTVFFVVVVVVAVVTITRSNPAATNGKGKRA